MKRHLWVVAVIAALGLAVAVQAQDLQKLSIPDEVNGELEGEPVDFELTSPETAIIELALASSDFDPYLEIRDDEGNILAQNDDGGEDSGSILYFVATAKTAYTVRARSYSDGAEGSFTLNVIEHEATEITIDQSATTDLETKPQFFTFTGKAGDEVDFVVEAESFDSQLALLDTYGNTLLSSDDGVGLNPFISDFLLPADGTYILSLSAYYDEPPADPIEISVRPTTIQDLVFDDTVTSEIEKSYLRFEATEGATYRIEIRADEAANFNVEVKPQTSDFAEVTNNSYGANSVTFEFTPTADGVYKLTISGTSADYESTTYTTTISEVK